LPIASKGDVLRSPAFKGCGESEGVTWGITKNPVAPFLFFRGQKTPWKGTVLKPQLCFIDQGFTEVKAVLKKMLGGIPTLEEAR
jgi:hypothetical protein